MSDEIGEPGRTKSVQVFVYSMRNRILMCDHGGKLLVQLSMGEMHVRSPAPKKWPKWGTAKKARKLVLRNDDDPRHYKVATMTKSRTFLSQLLTRESSKHLSQK